ncbi:MAG TPA: hypothetical protein VIV11_12265 [Kofleriaceae bacterium]
MAKRSPILGYNHNVRYRGLVFHVQTEDSGMLNPHLFTHLFYEGVIVSTRKLVYDSGSNEDAIKALMQAQHKAVMKDLRKGTFDDKIDAYLGGTVGLEPRSGAGAQPARAKAADPAAAQAAVEDSAPIEIVNEGLSEPIELPLKQQSVPVVSRTGTGDKTIRVAPPQQPPQPSDYDGPTDRSNVEETMAAAVRQANQQPAPPVAPARTKTAPKVSKTDVARAPTQLQAKSSGLELRDSSPIIEMEVDDDDGSGRHRGPRDTSVDDASPRTTTPSRPPSHGAATLPAMKQPSRPVAPVVSRPPTQDRKRPDSDVVEVYSPPPPSVEPPPGERAERAGQYSMSRKDGAAPIREKTGRIAAINQPATLQQQQPQRRQGSGANPVVARPGAQPPPVPPQARAATPAGGSRAVQPPPVPPNRIQATAPITNRTPSPAPPQAGSGVVMTRPAVIVGAPPKPQQQQPRVRKAREDEGRGFGQGLISEKSLDEVILAYLSEDAEDK